MSAVFRFDFNSPYAYLAATRIDRVLGSDTRWEPIAFGFLLQAQQRSPWSFDLNGERAPGMADCERRAARYGLPALTWPKGWPRESWSIESQRAAATAGAHGVGREYALAVFDRVWARGGSLRDIDTLADAGHDAGLDASAIRDGICDPAVKQRLRDATDAAIAAGVPGVPTVTVGDQHFWGDDRLEDAAAAIS